MEGSTCASARARVHCHHQHTAKTVVQWTETVQRQFMCLVLFSTREKNINGKQNERKRGQLTSVGKKHDLSKEHNRYEKIRNEKCEQKTHCCFYIKKQEMNLTMIADRWLSQQ